MSIVSFSRSKWIPMLGIAMVIVGLAVSWWLWKVSPVAPVATGEVGAGNVSPETAAAQKDAELKAQLVGYWFHSESGEHWIENRADGTARMLLKLDFVASLLYGQTTSMELSWEVKNGTLSHTVLSGSPQSNVDSLVKAFGKTRVYTILETTQERMLLESQNEKKKKDLWTRSPAPKEWSAKTPSTDRKRAD